MKKGVLFIWVFIVFSVFIFGCKKNNPTAPAAEPTQIPAAEDTLTATATITITPGDCATITQTASPVLSPSSTCTVTRTDTRTATCTRTPAATATFTRTATRTITRTITITATRTNTASNTPNATLTHVAAVATQTAIAVPVYSSQFGAIGTGNGQFNLPAGITVIGSNVYVCDRNNKRIQQFTTAGTYVRQWGNSTSFANPQGIDGYAGAGEDILFITDATKIKKFGISGSTPVYYGESAENFGDAWGGTMAKVTSDSFYFVPDTENNVIKKMDLSNVKQSQFGTAGSGAGQFNNPCAIAPDNKTTTQYFYVADTFNNRVHKFTAGGTHVLTWGSAGSTNGKFNTPYGIAVDSMGFVYVSDMTNRIQKFDSLGNYLSQWGSTGTGNGQFDIPGAIYIAGNVFYIVDAYNNRVQKFTY